MHTLRARPSMTPRLRSSLARTARMARPSLFPRRMARLAKARLRLRLTTRPSFPRQVWGTGAAPGRRGGRGRGAGRRGANAGTGGDGGDGAAPEGDGVPEHDPDKEDDMATSQWGSSEEEDADGIRLE